MGIDTVKDRYRYMYTYIFVLEHVLAFVMSCVVFKYTTYPQLVSSMQLNG